MADSTTAYLNIIAQRRTNAIVVTTMTASKLWPCYSVTASDIDYLPSAMSHASDLALGIAIANPQRTVLCVNGDGSLLMNLGTLVTTVSARATNLIMFVMANGVYQIVGGSPIPAAGEVRWEQLARACGWPSAWRCDDAAELDSLWPVLASAPGPRLVELNVRDGAGLRQQLPPRHPGAALRELRASLLRDKP